MATTTMTLVASNAIPLPTAPPEDKYSRKPTRQLPKSMIEVARLTERQKYDYNRHVNFQPPKKSLSMEELGYGGQGITPHAVSDPFPLFSEEGVEQMRREIFSEVVLEKHQYESSFIKNLIRGHCPEDAPFITDAWKDPKVLEHISKIAGLELVPSWDYEVGNAIIAWTGDGGDAEVSQEEAEKITKDSSEDASAAWHYDSVPFVCVTMLSDCTGMIGGETMIKTGYGDYISVRGPAMGTAVVMQGRYLAHKGLKALGRERIAMVTSLRPKSGLVRDDTCLTGVRGVSHVPELYYQYAKYRYENLEERFKDQARRIADWHNTKRPFDFEGAHRFLEQQKEYIETMLAELYEVK